MQTSLLSLGSTALISLLPIAGFAQAVVDVEFGEPEPLRKELHAFNSNLLMATALQGINYSSPEFRKGLEDLRPGGLRFPGGTTANNYLWREDSFATQADDKTKWAAQQLELFRKIGRPYDLAGYAKVCQEFGLSSIYVLNVYHETPESVVQMLDHFEEIGLELNAIEMGNEPYWDPRSLMNVWKYMEYCRPLAEAIRKHRPEIKIGACFGPVREGTTYAEKWNAPLAKQSWYDAIVYHEYYGGQGFAMEAGVELPMEALLRPEALIDEPVEHFAELLPDLPIWFTEWNIGQKGLGQWKNTGAELLFLGASLARLMEHRQAFEWSCFHQIFEAKFGTFFHDKEAGIQTLPSYEFFRLLGGLWDEAESFLPVQFGSEEDVLGFATERNGEIRLFVVNRGSKPTVLSLPEALAKNTGLTLAVEPEQKLPISSTLASSLPVDGGSVTVGPYSISLIAAKSTIDDATRSDRTESGNLFPPRPHLTLWYPPYARNQPRVSPDGSYEVDLEKLADKKTVVIKMNLAGIRPQIGDRLAVSFERKASVGIGFVAKTPNREKGDGTWVQLLPKWEKTRLEFVYDPEVNQGEISFFLAESALAKGGILTLRNFKVVRITQ